MLDRFYTPKALQQPTVTLAGAEAQHLSRVLRKQPGDEVTLFDGDGREVRASVDRLDRQTVTLLVAGPVVERRTTGPGVVLATAVPKGDRARWLVEKATELGAAGWVPLLTERSVVDPGVAKLEKLQQTVIAACKQCGRNDLMPIRQPRQWKEFLAEDCRGTTLLVADPAGPPLNESLMAAGVAEKGSLTVAVGPEGGFTDEELEAARARGARSCGLGEYVLRIETAAIAALAVTRT